MKNASDSMERQLADFTNTLYSLYWQPCPLSSAKWGVLASTTWGRSFQVNLEKQETKRK
jgi:hypothetical protein